MSIYLSQHQDLFINLSTVYPTKFQLLQENISIFQYELHLVEQWITDRSKTVNSVVNYTGDKRHEIKMASIKVLVSNPNVPEWTKFCGQSQSEQCRLIEMKEGKAFVYNILLIPSALNLIHVADGNLNSGLSVIKLNINLRRLGCSGRSDIRIQQPSAIQKEMFLQLYKTNNTMELSVSVFEIIRLVQSSLFLLTFLENKNFIDGFICDSTVDALKKFVKEEFGPFQSKISDERSVPDGSNDGDSFLDSTLVSILLSKIVTIRNQMTSFVGIQCPKNPFGELNSFMSCISAFQKIAKLSPTSLLDTPTLECMRECFVRSSPSAVSRVLKRLDENPKEHLDVETTELTEFIKTCGHLDYVKHLWGKKKHKINLDEQTENYKDFAGGLIQGGKELLKTVTRTQKYAEKPEKKQQHKKSARSFVSEEITKMSSNMGFLAPKRLNNEVPNSKAVENIQSYPSTSGNPSLKKYHRSLMELQQYQIPRTRQASLSPSIEIHECHRLHIIDTIVLKLKDQEIEMVNAIESLRQIANEYSLKIQTLSDVYLSSWHGFANIETLLNDLIDQQRLVQNRIDSLELRSSKLQYEVSVLEDKIRETDETIENLRNKISNIDTRVDQQLQFNENFDILSFIGTKISQIMARINNEQGIKG